jgi:hypothetical protein
MSAAACGIVWSPVAFVDFRRNMFLAVAALLSAGWELLRCALAFAASASGKCGFQFIRKIKGLSP